MALKESEAIVLRTYPLREADLLVTLFHPAWRARCAEWRARPRSRNAIRRGARTADLCAGIYEDRERQELARLDACEVLESPLASEVSYPRAVALAHVAELLDELLPDREASDAVFRLTLSVLQAIARREHLDAGHVFRAVDDAADGLFAGSFRVRRLRAHAEWQPGVLPRAGRRADVRRR